MYKQSYRPLSVSATLHIEVNIMMVMVWIVTVVVMMFLMVATVVVTMRAKDHLMTTRPWSLVRTCFSGAKATVYLEINMITDQ